MQHLKSNMSDKARREKMYAPKESNLPDDAFASDVIDPDYQRYYPMQTQVVMHHSTLSNHLDLKKGSGGCKSE